MAQQSAQLPHKEKAAGANPARAPIFVSRRGRAAIAARCKRAAHRATEVQVLPPRPCRQRIVSDAPPRYGGQRSAIDSCLIQTLGASPHAFGVPLRAQRAPLRAGSILSQGSEVRVTSTLIMSSKHTPGRFSPCEFLFCGRGATSRRGGLRFRRARAHWRCKSSRPHHFHFSGQ